MGGSGSGTWQARRRGTVEHARLALNVRALQRAGSLVPGRISEAKAGAYAFHVEASAEGVELVYRAGLAGKELATIRESVAVEWTPCHYGGSRPWFNCPGCARRVALLYLHGDRLRFRCRKCLRLLYESQRESDADRARRCANKIRRRLRLNLWPGEPEHGRPKGMHHTTYGRLLEEAESWDELSFALEMARGAALFKTPAVVEFLAAYRERRSRGRVSRWRPAWE